MNAVLDQLPHLPAVRAAMELLCRGSPILRTGSACNLSCTYCCVGPDGQPLEPEDTLRERVDGLAALGFRGLGYMGGEPTVHPGFLGVARHAKERGFECQMLCTNGLRMADGDFAARVFDAGVNAVTTSLDAFDPKVQEPLYGGRGQPGDALAGLRNTLTAPGVEVLLSAVVTGLNARFLPSYMQEVAALQQRHGKPIGVMLCVLQKPVRDGEAQRALSVHLTESSSLVAETLARAQALGVPAFTFGFPACMLPGHAQHLAERYATEWVVSLESGAVARSQLRDAAAYRRSCATCADAWYCPGVLKQYADSSVQEIVDSYGGRR